MENCSSKKIHDQNGQKNGQNLPFFLLYFFYFSKTRNGLNAHPEHLERAISHLKQCQAFANQHPEEFKAFSEEVYNPIHLQPLQPLDEVGQRTAKEKFGQFWFSANLSFIKLNMQELKDFLSFIRPDFKIPSENSMKTTVLQKNFEKTRERVFEFLISENKPYVLSFDGGKIVDSITNFALLSTGHSFFLESIHAGTVSRNAAYYTQKTVTFKNSLPLAVQPNIVGVITDNTTTNISAWAQIKSQCSSIKFLYGCAAHTLNLLLVDMSVPPTTQNNDRNGITFRGTRFARVSTLCKEISSVLLTDKFKDDIEAILHQNHLGMLNIPGQTRWSGYYDCALAFSQAIPFIYTTIVSDKFLGETQASRNYRFQLRNQFLETQFTADLQAFLALSQPVADQISLMQNNSLNLSTIIQSFRLIEQSWGTIPHLLQGEREFLDQILRFRFDFVVKEPHLFCLLLDPRFNINDFSSLIPTATAARLKRSLIQFIIQGYHPRIETPVVTGQWNCFTEFATTLRASGDPILEGTPNQQWLSFKDSFPLLYPLARELNRLPLSTAYVERSFSIQKCIKTANRGQLSTPHLSQLTFSKMNNIELNKLNANSNPILVPESQDEELIA